MNGKRTLLDPHLPLMLVKPSPVLDASGHGQQLGLAYGRETWAYPTNTVLATVVFLLLLDTNLLLQEGITHCSKLHYTKAPY